MDTEKLYYGAAYYPEYLDTDRMAEDMGLMRQAGFNLIRVGESTWSNWEPEDGKFDFSLLEKTLRRAEEFGLKVIVGTPTYAIPPWLAKKYPDIMALTHEGRRLYGARQSMDITHPGYLFHCERLLRRMMEVVRNYPCVIGFQLDNETKPYDICSEPVQARFREYLKEKFGTVQAMNTAFGFAYWSNAVADFDQLPDVRGTINASYAGEFAAFQRRLVTEFLAWQAEIVREYCRPGQFLTHNFDFAWRGYSFGLQPEVDQFQAAKVLDAAGVDIYHPGASRLTGAEISFGGDLARGLKGDNYLVLETQAQGNPGWLPYPGQLRLQAFSHLAGGSNCVEYWHWHSIHNSLESYWQGVLPHDLRPGMVYGEASSVGRDFSRLSPRLVNLKKKNRVAIVVSSRSLIGVKWFPTAGWPLESGPDYNDTLRWIYDAFYRLNVETDILPDDRRDFSGYDVVVLPCLYAAPDDLTAALEGYVRAGGHLIATFRTAFANEELKIYADPKPHGLTGVFGMEYREFTKPDGVRLSGMDTPALEWMELLRPDTAQVLASYDHPGWKGFAAVTRNRYGKGSALYIGCRLSEEALTGLLRQALPEMGLTLPEFCWPVVCKRGTNGAGEEILYLLHYAPEERTLPCPADGTELLSGRTVTKGESLTLPPWGVTILACPATQK